VNIQDVLNRRTDLSTFVVHLTRDEQVQPNDNGPPVFYPADQKLRSIIRERRLIAATPMGLGWDQDDPADPTRQTQRAVSFSETPLEHIYALVADIDGRQIKLEPYGLVLTKIVARREGVNPVWYVDDPLRSRLADDADPGSQGLRGRDRGLSHAADRAAPPVLRLDGRPVPQEPNEEGVLVGAGMAPRGKRQPCSNLGQGDLALPGGRASRLPRVIDHPGVRGRSGSEVAHRFRS
jgi:hypothetical protein